MEKKKVIKLFGALFLLILIFLPGYSKFQELAERNKALEGKIKKLEVSNKKLREELKKLDEDPTYLEKIAREKLRVTKKGEVVYKIVEGEKTEDTKEEKK